jgi:hypothetical protein
MISLDKPKQSQGPPETDHNSPQNPNIALIHSRVVRPHLLTFLLLKEELQRSRESRRENKSVRSKKKSPILERMGLQEYAGDHLISHTLTRAVPSAQRGLTSVFGMGTGVTLAVNSPANF